MIEATEQRLRATLRDAHAVLARSGGELVGCVFYAPMDDYMDLFRLAVLPAYRSYGIGGMLTVRGALTLDWQDTFHGGFDAFLCNPPFGNAIRAVPEETKAALRGRFAGLRGTADLVGLGGGRGRSRRVTGTPSTIRSGRTARSRSSSSSGSTRPTRRRI